MSSDYADEMRRVKQSLYEIMRENRRQIDAKQKNILEPRRGVAFANVCVHALSRQVKKIDPKCDIRERFLKVEQRLSGLEKSHAELSEKIADKAIAKLLEMVDRWMPVAEKEL